MLERIEPKALWQHFDQLRQIPRPSRHEERVREHIKKWAKDRGFEAKQDAIGNVCVHVPATKGHENAPVVVIQGHVDMVAEKDKATNFDFLKDPIEVRIDGDWVVADHTTLGADNGIGVAAAMASADDPSVVHGPLQLLFTIDEETGLTGASNLDPSIVNGRMLLNLDSEDDGVLFVGCAGGCTTEIELPITRAIAPKDLVALKVEVTGLKGGHSGLNINENRGNSIKIVARVLHRWLMEREVLVDQIEGGNKHNAIPREASAVALVHKDFAQKAIELAADEQAKAVSEYGTVDTNLQIKVTKLDEPVEKPANLDSSSRLIRMLIALPNGVLAMSRDIAGMTETSTNLAIIRTEGDKIAITTSTRSSVEAALRNGLHQTAAVVLMAGGTYQDVGGYPGWQPDMSSPLLKLCKEVHKDQHGKDPHVTAIHAGLECGIIGEKIGGKVDMISYGPQLMGVHAPGEKVQISSVARFWEFHKEVLKRLANA